MKLGERLRNYICGCGDGVTHDIIEQAEAQDKVVEAADIASRSQFNTPRHYCDIAKLKSALAAYEEATREPK